MRTKITLSMLDCHMFGSNFQTNPFDQQILNTVYIHLCKYSMGKKLLVAPGIATSIKKLLGTKGIPTSY